jgi:hypothetical protein
MFTYAGGPPQQITLGLGREDNLVAVWRLPADDHFYYQHSTDNGASWSRPQHIPGVIAKPWMRFSLDAYHTATDSAGNVHLLVLVRLLSSEEELGLIHLAWNGAEWSPPTRIYVSRDPPEWPRIDIAMGNKVFATWFTRDERHIWESERGQYKVWVSSYQADAPTQTDPFLLTSAPTPTLMTLTHATPSPTPIPTLVMSGPSGLPQGLYTEGDEVARLVVSLSPVAAVLLVIVVLRFGWPKRQG